MIHIICEGLKNKRRVYIVSQSQPDQAPASEGGGKAPLR